MRKDWEKMTGSEFQFIKGKRGFGEELCKMDYFCVAVAHNLNSRNLYMVNPGSLLNEHFHDRRLCLL